jgi:hypothetical protein
MVTYAIFPGRKINRDHAGGDMDIREEEIEKWTTPEPSFYANSFG